MSNIIDGKKIAEQIKQNLAVDVTQLKQKGINVGLAVVIVGNDPASRVYVNSKKKDCELVGIKSIEYALSEETTEQQLLELIDKLNADNEVNGILVQLPLPKHIDENKVIEKISPNKDVDAFHPYNVGKIMIGDFDFLPCTPAGCMDLIESTGVEIAGKNCVVVGRSNIVGKPMMMLLLHKSGTVTICHSKTKNLAEICSKADILVVAIGRANFITKDMIKPGAVVIDVGMNRLEDGKLYGDVEFSGASEVASFITPVPGGVGLMTRATLLKNTITAAIKQNSTN